MTTPSSVRNVRRRCERIESTASLAEEISRNEKGGRSDKSTLLIPLSLKRDLLGRPQTTMDRPTVQFCLGTDSWISGDKSV